MATTLTWYSDTNYQFPDYSSADAIQRSTLWILKAFLQQQIVGTTNGPNGTAPAGAAWTCVGSSDGSGNFNMSGTDLWGSTYDASKLVYASNGNNHSWMVLQSPAGIASNGPYQLLMDCNSSGTNVRLSLSRAGFTGGSATFAPTATDQASYMPNPETLNGETTTTSASYGHITRTATGAFYFTTSRVGATSLGGAFISAVPLVNQNPSDQWRLFGIFMASQLDTLRVATRIALRAYNDTSVSFGNAYVVNTAIGNGGFPANYTGLNAVTGAYTAYPFGLFTNSAGASGYRGQLPDIYAIGLGRVVGDVAPATGAQEYVCSPYTLLPFNCLLTV